MCHNCHVIGKQNRIEMPILKMENIDIFLMVWIFFQKSLIVYLASQFMKVIHFYWFLLYFKYNDKRYQFLNNQDKKL